MTSHDVVARVRKALNQRAVGHTGTLDPLATGLMVMVLGEATKLSDYLTAADKAYRVKVRLGVKTDSLDRTGKVLEETPCDLPKETIERAALALQGEFEWPIPLFSAAKVDGKKLYEYGREGQDVVRPLKTMKFWDVRVLEAGQAYLEAELSCSKGSFIRSWASEVGESLGVGGCIDALERTRVGHWSLSKALPLETLSAAGLGQAFIPMGQALPSLKAVTATPREMKLLSNGQIPHDLGTRLIFEQKQAIATEKAIFVKVISGDGELLAILSAEPRQGLKIRRVFRPNP